jgi:Ca-activated chloride channel family protein
LIHIRQADGTTTFLKDDQGNVVKSRLNETVLQQIATAASGFYLPLRGANPMETLYTRGLAPLPKAEAAATLIKTFRERFHWPLGVAIALLILEVFLPQPKKPRVTEAAATPAPASAATAKAIATGMLALLLPVAALASPSSALKKYETGEFEAALREYERLLQQRTNDHRLHFNAGASAYQAGQLDAAQQHFEHALLSPDLKLQENGYYNLGNTLYQLGESTPEMNVKKGLWEQALNNYDNALRLNATNVHATNNLQFVKRRIEELKREQEQSQDSEKGEGDEESEQQDQSKGENQQGPEQEEQPSDSEQQEQQQQQQSEQEQQQQQDQPQEQEQQQQQSGDEGEESGEEAQATPAGQMTLEQAQQLLEAQKQDERTLIFRPDAKPPATGKKLKDW